MDFTREVECKELPREREREKVSERGSGKREKALEDSIVGRDCGSEWNELTEDDERS